jgi:hypothetical protein
MGKMVKAAKAANFVRCLVNDHLASFAALFAHDIMPLCLAVAFSRGAIGQIALHTTLRRRDVNNPTTYF